MGQRERCGSLMPPRMWNDDKGFGFIEPDSGGGEVSLGFKLYEAQLTM